MKTKINITLVLGLIALLSFSSCEKEEDFDFAANVTPLITGMSGSGEFPSAIGSTSEYKVDIRSGSTYTWAVTEGNDIVSIAAQEDSYKATVSVVKEVTANTDVTITVSETTIWGLTSEIETMVINVTPYVYVDLDAFTGAYTEADGDGQTCPVVITRDPDDELFGLILTGVVGEDYWWGAPGGVLKIKLFGVDNSVYFDKQVTGIVSATYGDVSIELLDGIKGSFDLTTKTISFQGKITVAAGSFGDYPFVYTKD